MLVIVEIITLVIAALLYKQSVPQYIIFSLPYIALFAVIVIVGLIVSSFFITLQNSAEHIKGKVPKRGIYVTTILAKCVFVTFIMFFLSIAIRNAIICSNTIQTARFISEKTADYVTVPVNESNASARMLADNYISFYAATVERYQGVLIDASNYEYELISGRTLAEEYGQDEVTINRNYLKLNPIYDTNGQAVEDSTLSAKLSVKNFRKILENRLMDSLLSGL